MLLIKSSKQIQGVLEPDLTVNAIVLGAQR